MTDQNGIDVQGCVSIPLCKQGMWVSKAENRSTAGSLFKYVT